jgi:FMN phosphatase YigB (HAD superfamily)
MPEAFAAALRLLDIVRPEEAVLIDDSPRNLAGARAYGLRTIHVGNLPPQAEWDASITQLSDLPAALSVWA